MVRLFVGIKIEKQEKIANLANQFQKKLIECNINWANSISYHLTLKFLGDVEPYYINSINTLLSHICLKHKPFTLEYNEPGFFGSFSQPKVIWFNFKDNKELNNLQKSIDNSLSELGFNMEEKKFKPHLTLARVKKIINETDFKELFQSYPEFNDTIYIKQFQLIESVLKPSGPVYTTISEFNL